MTELDVLAVGDLNPDLLVSGDVTPRFGQAEQDVSAHLTLGGSAAIFAAGAARLGLRTAIAATVGDDDLGRATCAMLAARGVEVGAVGVDPDRPTGLSINLQRDDDRAILTDRGAIPALDVAAAVAAAERGVRHVHHAALLDPNAASSLSPEAIEAVVDELLDAHAERLPAGLRR